MNTVPRHQKHSYQERKTTLSRERKRGSGELTRIQTPIRYFKTGRIVRGDNLRELGRGRLDPRDQHLKGRGAVVGSPDGVETGARYAVGWVCGQDVVAVEKGGGEGGGELWILLGRCAICTGYWMEG